MCKQCQDAFKHKQKASKAREKYQEDMAQSGSYSVDMQKVIILPKLTTKEHIFTSRLVCFNETFSAGTAGSNDFTVLWHEAMNGRKAGDVTSAFVKFFIASQEKNPVLWADNCFGQNKNWTLYTAFVLLVNTDWGPESITIKYLESGHTFMRADSVHGVIGKKMKATPEIVTFEDLVQLISQASARIKVLEMNISDFYAFKAENRARSSKFVKMPKLSEAVEVKFVRESRLMYMKRAHEHTEYEGIDFLRPKVATNQLPEKLRDARGLSSKKKAGIMKILGHVAPLKRKFYGDLAENDNAQDLVSRFDL